MKTKNIIKILITEAIICALMAGFTILNTQVLSSLFAFPFEQIAFVLRWLSLKEGSFNLLALCLYILISSLPIIYLFAKPKATKKSKDFLLIVISISIFVGLYLMINPQLIANFLNPVLNAEAMGITFGKTVLGGVIYSGIVAYIILSLIDITNTNNDIKLQNYMLFTLISLCVILVFDVFGFKLQATLKTIKEISLMSVSQDTIYLSFAFTLLNFITASIPIILSISIILNVINVGICYFERKDKSSILDSCKKLGEISKKNLEITVLTSLGFNIIQLPFSRSLINTSYSIVLPILSIILLFGALIFAKMVEENHSLREDNESII